jgi:Ca2+-binding EF-hand superfamily protein
MTTALVNERLSQRFRLWDRDGDGVLERSDLEQEATRIAGAFGKPAGSQEARALKDAFARLFEYHTREAGLGPNDSITRDAFLRINESLIFKQGEAAFRSVLGPVVTAVIGLCDKNADGRINQEEFRAWLNGVGVPESKSEEIFQQLDTNNSGELSEDELLEAVRKFHFGELEFGLLG